MRRLMIGIMLMSVVLVACGGDDDTPEPEAGGQSSPAVENGDVEEPGQDEFLFVVDNEALVITESCVDDGGTYTAQLDGGGLFILREGDAPQEFFVDFQASADADPLSSQSPEDTQLLNEGGFTTGTSTVYTEDGANNLPLEFGVQIEGNEC